MSGRHGTKRHRPANVGEVLLEARARAELVRRFVLEHPGGAFAAAAAVLVLVTSAILWWFLG